MSHFSKHVLESDPEGLARLREILHGRSTASRAGKAVHATPTLAERFGTCRGGPDKPTPPSRFALATNGAR